MQLYWDISRTVAVPTRLRDCCLFTYPIQPLLYHLFPSWTNVYRKSTRPRFRPASDLIMTTSNITFPPELVEAFVEQLAPGNGIILSEEILQTLIACTLASKYFSFAARKRLFSTLMIDKQPRHLLQRSIPLNKTRTEEEISRRINTFLDLLADERSSDLALMVHSLHIIVDKECIILQQATNLHGLLKDLSHRAHNLSILLVHGRISFSWTTIPQGTADGLQALCRSLPVNHLSFSCVHDIPPIIASVQTSPHLRHIDLKDSKFGTIEAGMAAGSNISPTRSVTSGNLDLLGSLPRFGSYEICYTYDGRTHIVSINTTIRYPDDAQRLNQLLSDERVCSSLRYCCCTFSGIYRPFLTTTLIDFGTMVLLRQLAIELSIGADHRTEITTDITNAMNTLIDCLYNGNTKSVLQEIKVTLNAEYVLYKGTSMFDTVDFSPLQRLRIDSLWQKHPLIQSTQFYMNMELKPRNYWPLEVQSSAEEIVRKLITDALTLPPVDESLLPKIHICAKRRY
ncbi:hypothetical protein CVT25_013148 [Psilocybe cyanescens]|uniref:F-box domain-containing protein n=1 Tax=Psilocybe cyanescens TaxID=93625 RepID=A0A409XK59_PSICY|nr:hypothetical protein CVT25_013148 [Psilocybe cyanescens]